MLLVVVVALLAVVGDPSAPVVEEAAVKAMTPSLLILKLSLDQL
jgi:hypothetical protein